MGLLHFERQILFGFGTVSSADSVSASLAAFEDAAIAADSLKAEVAAPVVASECASPPEKRPLLYFFLKSHQRS